MVAQTAVVGAVQHRVTQRFHFANTAHTPTRIVEDVIYYDFVFVYYRFCIAILLMLLLLLHIHPCYIANIARYFMLQVFVVVFCHIIRLMTDFVSRFAARRHLVTKFPRCAGSTPAWISKKINFHDN